VCFVLSRLEAARRYPSLRPVHEASEVERPCRPFLEVVVVAPRAPLVMLMQPLDLLCMCPGERVTPVGFARVSRFAAELTAVIFLYSWQHMKVHVLWQAVAKEHNSFFEFGMYSYQRRNSLPFCTLCAFLFCMLAVYDA